MPAPDWYNLIARDRGAPEGWRWYSLIAKGESREHGFVLVKGAVPKTITRGPRKGQPKWGPKDTTERELAMSFLDIDNRKLQWEVETGTCGDCGGDCRTTVSFNAKLGVTETVPCARCGGAGKPPAASISDLSSRPSL